MIHLGVFNSHEFSLITDILSTPENKDIADLILPTLLERTDTNNHPQITHLITGRFGKDDLRHFSNLTHIFVPYTGLDDLDLDVLKAEGIHVHNTSAHAPFIAERAFAFILALQGKLLPSHHKLVQRDWSRDGQGGYGQFWHSLFDKKVAIYGYGHIGQHLHTMLMPFRCSIGVLAYKNREYNDTTRFSSLPSLAQWCDIMVVTAPLTDKTYGSINQEVLHEMKGKTLVNVARGLVIDEEALYDSLKNIGLYGFGSDVWYHYPSKQEPLIYPSKYNLHQFDNVIMTPHDGGAEISSRQVRYEDTLNQILKTHG
ncbi:NAD(P)-dependent oxidoreductase [Vallitaleaceae bacterium 9-2]